MEVYTNQIKLCKTATNGSPETLLTKGWSFRHALRSWASRLNAMPDMICGLLQGKRVSGQLCGNKVNWATVSVMAVCYVYRLYFILLETSLRIGLLNESNWHTGLRRGVCHFCIPRHRKPTRDNYTTICTIAQNCWILVSLTHFFYSGWELCSHETTSVEGCKVVLLPFWKLKTWQHPCNTHLCPGAADIQGDPAHIFLLYMREFCREEGLLNWCDDDQNHLNTIKVDYNRSMMHQ